MSSNALPVQQSNIIPFPSCDVPMKSSEWYTPARYVDAARRVMHSIDLDPASCAKANEIVQATRYYTEQEDGLAQAWHGNVWLNPPYGRTPEMRGQHKSTIKFFVDKLISVYQSGDVSQAVLLTTCRCDTAWFLPLWQFPICFADHKVGFYSTRTGRYLQEQCHTMGTVFVYLGTNEQAFIREFSKFGHIAKSIAGPRRETVQARLWGAV